nr:MBL fold metallo-hydrolase [Candidatus Sigynarchaeota archaeon]
MVSVSFFGGIEKIGGNCIIVEEDGHRVMLDNGMNFGVDGMYYKDFLMARSGNGMRDLLALNIIHPIPGIYAKSAINDPAIEKVDKGSRYMHENPLESYEDHVQKFGRPFIDAILISHAHVDHVRNLAFMAREIPVVMSEATRCMLKVMKDVSSVDCLNFCTQRLTTYNGGAFFPGDWKRETDCSDREIIIAPSKDPITFGPFTVNAYPIDHSIPGALAFDITTESGKSIVYTGDIRFHGVAQEKQNALAFVEKMASKERVDALISEGTRIQSTNESGEGTVFENA